MLTARTAAVTAKMIVTQAMSQNMFHASPVELAAPHVIWEMVLHSTTVA